MHRLSCNNLISLAAQAHVTGYLDAGLHLVPPSNSNRPTLPAAEVGAGWGGREGPMSSEYSAPALCTEVGLPAASACETAFYGIGHENLVEAE